MLIIAFYSLLERLAIGTPVSGLRRLWCLLFSPYISALILYSCSLYEQTKTLNRREGIVSSSDVLNFIVILKSEQAVKDS